MTRIVDGHEIVYRDKTRRLRGRRSEIRRVRRPQNQCNGVITAEKCVAVRMTYIRKSWAIHLSRLIMITTGPSRNNKPRRRGRGGYRATEVRLYAAIYLLNSRMRGMNEKSEKKMSLFEN